MSELKLRFFTLLHVYTNSSKHNHAKQTDGFNGQIYNIASPMDKWPMSSWIQYLRSLISPHARMRVCSNGPNSITLTFGQAPRSTERIYSNYCNGSQ